MISKKEKESFDLTMGSVIYYLEQAKKELEPLPNENLPFEYRWHQEDIQIKIGDLLEDISSTLDELNEED